MFKVFSFCLIMISIGVAHGQSANGPGSDEFDISEPAFEVNNSKDGISELERPTESPTTLPDIVDLQDSQTDDTSASQGLEGPDSLNQNDRTVMKQERRSLRLESEETSDSVEVRSSRTIFLPYKQRQNTWGFNLSIGAEFVTFPNLISQFDTNSFQDLFGADPLMMPSFELGPRYNTQIGSIGLMLGYANLSASDDRIQVQADLDITRYTATLTYYLDTIWPEPYFVPYVSVGAWQSEYSERTEDQPDVSAHYSTDVGYHWRVGALLGLDWIEPTTAIRTRRSIGLQGTFLNVYATSSYMSESEPDPDLQNEMDIGASLILEF